MKLEDKESSDSRKLVLGYDGGCFTCLELARRIDERVGDKLEVRNLRGPRLMEWRKEALGEDAPWAPTLFEVKETKVRAWTGLKMGLILTRFLGPADTWRVMQAVGEMGATSKIVELPAARAVEGLTRGQFLKGVGGAAVAMSVLSGAGGLASPATAADRERHGGNRGEHHRVHEIHGADLVRKARQKARTEDVINVAGQRWSEEMQSGEVIRECFEDKDGRRKDDKNDKDGHDCVIVIATGKNCRIDRDGHDKKDHDKKGKEDRDGREKDKKGRGEPDIKGNCTIIKAAKVRMEDGNHVLAVSYVLPNGHVVHYHEYEKPLQRKRGNNIKIKTRAKLWGLGKKKAHLKEYSINGRPATLHGKIRRKHQEASDAQDETCECYEPACVDVDWFCLSGTLIGATSCCSAITTGIGSAICVACLGLAGAATYGAENGGPCCDEEGYACSPC